MAKEELYPNKVIISFKTTYDEYVGIEKRLKEEAISVIRTLLKTDSSMGNLESGATITHPYYDDEGDEPFALITNVKLNEWDYPCFCTDEEEYVFGTDELQFEEILYIADTMIEQYDKKEKNN